MSSENQHFCLKWNHHQNTLVSLFSSLLDSNTFVDCTLAAGGKQIKAHKMILSACSPYFKEILLEHDDMHPIIILNSISFSELTAIVGFMYRGEVNVSQEMLPTFLKAANALQIKGLTNDEDTDGGDETDESEQEPAKENNPKATPDPVLRTPRMENNVLTPSTNALTPTSIPIPASARMPTSTPILTPMPVDEESPNLRINDSFHMGYNSTSEDSAISAHSSIARVKMEPDDDSHLDSYPLPSAFMKQETYVPSPNANSTIMGLLHQPYLLNSLSDDGGHFSGIGSSKMIQLRRPNATERDAAFKCDACPKFYRSKTSLNLHKRWECGKEPKFSCPYCDKKCHQKGNLKVHIISRHRDRINPNEHQLNNTT